MSDSIFNCMMKYLSSMDINNEILEFHRLRNKFAYLLLDTKLYCENDYASLESLIAVFFSCVRHDNDGLISTQFMSRILRFSFIFNLNLNEEMKVKEEFIELKKNYFLLILIFLKISIENKKEEIIIEYFSFLNQEENKSNVYLCYKLLKCLYFTETKDLLLDLFGNIKDFNLNAFFMGTIECLEYKYLDNKEAKKNIKEFEITELLKALAIRFVDEYIIKNEKNDNKSQERTPSKNKLTVYYSNTNALSKENTNLHSISKKSNYSPNHYASATKQNIIAKNSKIYKHSLMERIIELIIPTQYTIRSLILTIFHTPEANLNFNYIKNSQQINFSFYSKDALVILIKLVERISNYQFTETPYEELELLKFIYDHISNFLFNIIDKYFSNKNDKELRKYFSDIFESNKICLKFYFLCLNSYYLNAENESVNTNSNLTDQNSTENILPIEGNFEFDDYHKKIALTSEFKDNIKISLIKIITKTINHHQNPFYFNLIIALYTKTQEVSLIIDLLDVVITENVKNCNNKEVNQRYVITNQKNIILLLYRIMFMSIESPNKGIFFNKQFEEKIKLFLTSIASNQIIYTKMRFNITYYKKNYSDVGKQRTILEMVFEILLELYQIYNEEKYIKLLEDIVISNKHTIFYYMDLFYFYPQITSDTVTKRFDKKIIEMIETNVFKEGSVSIFFSNYIFLVKTFVYIYEMENTVDSSVDKNFLIKLAQLLTGDIVHLLEMVKVKSLHIPVRVEIKDTLYVELKNYIEQYYFPNKERDYNLLKQKFIEAIEKNKNETKKYFKLTSSKIGTVLESKLENSCKRHTKDKYNITKSNSSDSLIVKNSFITNTTELTSLNAINTQNIFRTNYNSNEDNIFGDLKNSAVNLQVTQTENSVKSSFINEKTRRPTDYTQNTNPPLYLNTTPENYKFKSGMINYSTTNSDINDKFSQFLLSTQVSMKSNKTYNPMIDINFNNFNSLILQNNKNTESTVYIILNSGVPLTFKDYIISKPKKDLLLTTFGVFFRDNFFNSPLFVNEIKKKFETNLLSPNEEIGFNTLNYPVKVKNIFTSAYMRPFLKPDVNFFNSKFLKISHDYFVQNENSNLSNSFIRLNPIQFFQYKNVNQIQEDLFNIIDSFPCEYITIEGVIFGKLYITKEFVLFKSTFEDNFYHPESHIKYNSYLDYVFSSLESDIIFVEKEIKIYYKDVQEIIVRKFLHMWQANEIFLKNGKSFLFNLFRSGKNQKFMRLMEYIGKGGIILCNFNVIVNCRKYFKENEFTKKWIQGELSNMDYILLINKFGGRSFHDVNQYPVFPWIVTNYSDSKINTNDKMNYRNLSYPISVQSEDKRQIAIKKYEDEDAENHKLHFRCHYSTSAFISYYLMRLSPFNHNLIKLQSCKFDHPNRMFLSIKETWDILEKNCDNREMTPEFFFQPELLINLNCNNFGVRNSDNIRVNNLQLPEWASNPVDFIHKHRCILESKTINLTLNTWIDNIFGSNQFVKNKESLNVFTKFSYEQEINLEKKLEKYLKNRINEDDVGKIVNKLRNKINIILNFGQTPHKLFDDKHPKKVVDIKQSKSDEYTEVSDLIKSKQKLSDCKKGVRYFNYSKNHIYILNGEKEVEIFDRLKFIKKNKIRLKHFLHLNMLQISHPKEKNLPIYRLKYALIDLKDTKFFVTCRHIDRSIKIYYGDGNIKEILCDSFVTSLAKLKNEEVIFTGHDNGKLLSWSVDYNKKHEIVVKPFKELIAHEDAVTSVLINEQLNIIVTGGEDGHVYIRSLYDYEILSCIKPRIPNIDRNLKIIDLAIGENTLNNNLVYITCYDNDKIYLFGYTLNSVLFCMKEGFFNNVEVTSGGKIIYGSYLFNRIYIVDPIDFNKVNAEIKLEGDETNDMILHFSSLIENNHLVYGYQEGTLKKTLLPKEKEGSPFE